MKPRKLLVKILAGYGGARMKDYHVNIFYSEEDGGGSYSIKLNPVKPFPGVGTGK